MADLQTKYQKLATEYAKLKSQLPVLKKALIDEQAKETDLREVLKVKDQSIRKSEQELESLQFRNQQLSKRVSALQEDLDKSSQHGSKKRPRAESNAMTNTNMAVLNEELQNKIRENEKLHKELGQLRKDTQMSTMQLKDRVDTLEYSEKQHNEKLNSTTQEYKALLGKLREEKALLEVRLENQERSVRDAKLKASTAQDAMQHLETMLSTELAAAKKTIFDKIPFNDTRSRELNSLNIPTHDRKYQLKTKEQLRQIYSMLKEVCKSFSDIFTYLEQRYQIYPLDSSKEPLSATVHKLCEHLKKGPTILKNVEETFRQFHENQPVDSLTTLETASSIGLVADSFTSFSCHYKKVLPYLILSLEEESNMSVCTQALRGQNSRIGESFTHQCAMVDKVNGYMKLLAAQSANLNDHPKLNQGKMLKLFIHSLHQLHQSAKDLSVIFNNKSQLDKQLPTSTDRLSTTDQCLIKSFLALTTSTSKLSHYMTENFDGFVGSGGYRTRGGSVLGHQEITDTQKHDPVVSNLQQSATSYLKSLCKPAPQTVPYAVAIENMKVLFSSTESRESLSEQVTKLNEKIGKLEQDKEHWMLEAQLLKIKFDKQQKLIGDSSRSASPVQKAAVEAPSPPPPVQDGPVKRERNPSDLENGAGYEELGYVMQSAGASDAETREQLLKAHYTERVAELSAKLQASDSKALAFHAECRAVIRRLQLADKSRLKSQEELEQANSKITLLQDELLTTKRSYDSQLSTMSEALASMNGNLASQQDEIEELKIQLKNARKGKR